jgi:hypothetical protein
MELSDYAAASFKLNMREQVRAITHDDPLEQKLLRMDCILKYMELALAPIAKEWMRNGGRLTQLYRLCPQGLLAGVKGDAQSLLIDSDDDDDDESQPMFSNVKQLDPPRDGAVSRLGEPDAEDEAYLQKLRKAKTRPLSAPPGTLLRARARTVTDFSQNEPESYALCLVSIIRDAFFFAHC